MASALSNTDPFSGDRVPVISLWPSATNPKNQSALSAARVNLGYGYAGAISALLALTNPAGAATTNIMSSPATEASAPQALPYAAPVLAAHFVEPQEEMASFASLDAGWDGWGSVPPITHAIKDALAFLRLLPPTAPAPEATASADGYVGWYWKTPKAAISITFKGGSKMAYYGEHNSFGLARGAGHFDRKSIPGDLFEVIRRA